MAKEKVNAADFVELLSQQMSISKKASDDFLKTLLTTIEDALISQDNVKIKGLGTFKLQWNEPRKSVDVNTGDEIIIEGYHKVVFTPDVELKELANEPYAHLQPVPFDDEGEVKQSASIQETANPNQTPLRHFDEQANEIKDILSEINALSKKPEVEDIKEEETTEVIIEDTQFEDVVSADELEKIEETHESKTEQKPLESIRKQNQTADYQPVKRKSFSSSRKSNKLDYIFIGIMLGGLLVYLLIDLDLFTSLKNIFNTNNSHYNTYQPVSDDFLLSESIVADIVAPDTVMSQQSITIPEEQVVVDSQVDELQRLFDQPRVYKEFIATEEVIPGSRLTRIAERHYGVREFWVYIFEANQDQFSSPDEIEPGMVLKIPKLNPLLTDVNNPRCMEYALKLHDLYLNQ